MLPNAIDHNARGERVVRVRDGLGEFEAAVAVLEWLRVFSVEHVQELPRNLLPEAGGFAAIENARVWVGGVFVDHQRGGCSEFNQAAVDVSLQLPKSLSDGR